MFLTARRFLYQQVYFHRTVRAIDLDLRRGLRAVDPGDLRRRLAGRAPGRLRRPRRVRPAPPGGPLGARRGRRSGDGATRAGRRDASRRRSPTTWRAILLRRPTGAPRPRSAPSTRRASGPTSRIAALGAARARAGRDRPRRSSTPGRPTRPPAMRLLALEGRDGGRRRSRRPGARVGCPPTRSSRRRYRRRDRGALDGPTSGLRAVARLDATPRRRWPVRDGRTSSGSIRAISAARQLHALGDVRVDPELAASRSGLNSP